MKGGADRHAYLTFTAPELIQAIQHEYPDDPCVSMIPMCGTGVTVSVAAGGGIKFSWQSPVRFLPKFRIKNGDADAFSVRITRDD